MDLEARLRAFSAAVRNRSVSRAAGQLGISQPAVSKHIADLEAHVGARLLIREPRGVRPTPAGEFLAGHLARAEALLAQASAGVVTIARGESGRLVVAASSTPGVYLLPRVIAALTSTWPEIDLEILAGTTAETIDVVRSHRAEIGLVGGQSAAPDLETEVMVEDEIVVVGTPAVAASRPGARELERMTWLGRKDGSATGGMAARGLQDVGIQPGRQLSMPDWEMVKLAVQEGAGVAAISRLAVHHELSDGRLAVIEIPGWHVVRPLSVVRPRGIALAPMAEAFVFAVRRLIGSALPPRVQVEQTLEWLGRAEPYTPPSEVLGSLQHAIALLEAGGVDEADGTLVAALRSRLVGQPPTRDPQKRGVAEPVES